MAFYKTTDGKLVNLDQVTRIVQELWISVDHKQVICTKFYGPRGPLGDTDEPLEEVARKIIQATMIV